MARYKHVDIYDGDEATISLNLMGDEEISHQKNAPRKERSYDSFGDPYAIRTHECIRERDMS